MKIFIYLFIYFSSSEGWNSTVSILNGYHRHLQRMEDETLMQLMDSYDLKIKSYLKDFDLSKSCVEKVIMY